MNNLDQINFLSSSVLQLIDLRKGSFFTLFFEDADLSQLYKFSEGGILVQNPIEEQITNGRKSFYTWIPTIKEEISDLLVRKIMLNPICTLYLMFLILSQAINVMIYLIISDIFFKKKSIILLMSK
jgi:hypothetical protein